MAVYKVIQDIEAEDKLLGPLTLKQFIFAIISAGFIFSAFMIVSKTGMVYLAIPFLPFIIVFGVLAAPLSKDQSTDLWLAAKIRFYIKPRKRIWDQSGIKELVTITVPKKEIKQLTKNLSQGEVKSRLEALADTLDSRGWAVKNVGLSNPAFAYAYAGGEDRLIDPASLPSAVEDTITTGADDILDPTFNPTAQHFEEMVQASTAQHKAQAIEQMRQAIDQSNQPATQTATQDQQVIDSNQTDTSHPKDYYFMHEPENPENPDDVVFTEQILPTQKQQLISDTNNNSESENMTENELLEKIHQSKAQDSFRHPHHKTIKTTEQIEKENLARQQAQALAEQLAKEQVAQAPNPINKELSQSNDLNISTISTLANRKKNDGTVEVDLR